MIIKILNHGGYDWTANLMYFFATNFDDDLKFTKLSLNEFFDYLKNIPYQYDGEYFKDEAEFIGRPKHLVKMPKLDCKKKAILSGYYFKKNNIPFRFIGISERADKKIHHVFAQFWDKLIRQWINFDATLPDYYINQGKTDLTNYRLFL